MKIILFIFLLPEIMMKEIIIKITVIFDLPVNIDKLIQNAFKVHDSMSNSTYFTASAVKLTTLADLTKKLQETKTDYLTKPPTFTITDVNAVAAALRIAGRSLNRDVQELCDASPALALQIAEASGMKIKKPNKHGTQKSSAKNGSVPGEVLLKGEGGGNHLFRYSTDNKTWIYPEPNGTSKLTVTGLTSQTLYYFQNKTVLTKGRKSAYTDSITLNVN